MPAEGALRDRLGTGHALIETLRWDPAAGFVRLGRHLGRMAASAQALGFPFDRDAAENTLAAAADADAPLRMRLTLAADGVLEATAAPFTPLPAGARWRIAVADTRLDSTDPLLAHKTTRRAVYESARAEYAPADADEVLLFNERGELCEGTITSVFLDMDSGPLLTPAMGCGLLPGVLRAELLEQGKAVEAVIDLAMLRAARAILVGNSLRGLIPAGLA